MTFGTDTMHHYRFTCKTSTSLSTLLPLPHFIRSRVKEVATFSDIERLRETIFIQFNNMYINCEIFQAMKLFSIYSDNEEFEKKNVILL